MSTRSVFRFTADGFSVSVYKHYDGYPAGAAVALQLTLDSKKAWELPRFEADEFAAAFVAANKTGQGNIRLMQGHDIPGDVEYVYHITQAKNGQLIVSAWDADSYTGHLENPASKRCKPFYYARLKEFIAANSTTAA